jgi:NADPH-dependent 2,4-dienoyl-CoA reductase/sulfur reductase-like enzyme
MSNLTKIGNMHRLGKAMDRTKRVLVVGAGITGLEYAESVLENVGQVIVLDSAPRILSGFLDDDHAAGLIQKHLESKGVVFRLSTNVRWLGLNIAVLENGEMINYDAYVLETTI